VGAKRKKKKKRKRKKSKDALPKPRKMPVMIVCMIGVNAAEQCATLHVIGKGDYRKKKKERRRKREISGEKSQIVS